MTNFILISGERFSGKDTVADYFVEKHQYTKIALADTLKEHVANLFDFPVAWCYNREGKKKVIPFTGGRTVGEILVTEGVHIRNTYNPEFWCRKLLRRIRNTELRDVVIPDCRFANEYEFFKKKNASAECPYCEEHTFCFVLERPTARGEAEKSGDKRDPNNESETGWRDILSANAKDPFVDHIVNDHGLGELYANVESHYQGMIGFHRNY